MVVPADIQSGLRHGGAGLGILLVMTGRQRFLGTDGGSELRDPDERVVG